MALTRGSGDRPGGSSKVYTLRVASEADGPVSLQPTLVVISGPPGSGKTTLAHRIARALGCPAISRDEIKEGMARNRPGFVPRPGDELTARTLPVFFEVLEVLLRADVTVVAEAAFQDKVWRRGLDPLSGLARVRVVRCVTGRDVADRRILRRADADPVRRVHADNWSPGVRAPEPEPASDRFLLDAPRIEVDTTNGYVPALEEIVAFAAGLR